LAGVVERSARGVEFCAHRPGRAIVEGDAGVPGKGRIDATSGSLKTTINSSEEFHR